MQRYKNLGGISAVSAFEIADDSIIVQFNDGATYLFNGSKPGKQYVDRMQQLAIAGQGLNSFISKSIKKNYASKLR